MERSGLDLGYRFLACCGSDSWSCGSDSPNATHKKTRKTLILRALNVEAEVGIEPA
jgi:hypothetical protein